MNRKAAWTLAGLVCAVVLAVILQFPPLMVLWGVLALLAMHFMHAGRTDL